MASCFRGAFPPVDLRAVCFVRAIPKFNSKNRMNATSSKENLYVARCVLIGSKVRDMIGSSDDLIECHWLVPGSFDPQKFEAPDFFSSFDSLLPRNF